MSRALGLRAQEQDCAQRDAPSHATGPPHGHAGGPHARAGRGRHQGLRAGELHEGRALWSRTGPRAVEPDGAARGGRRGGSHAWGRSGRARRGPLGRAAGEGRAQGGPLGSACAGRPPGERAGGLQGERAGGRQGGPRAGREKGK
jgi:hypothetical protein